MEHGLTKPDPKEIKTKEKMKRVIWAGVDDWQLLLNGMQGGGLSFGTMAVIHSSDMP